MDGGPVNELNGDSNADQAFDATIEELCKNLYELQSSTNQSPSRQSFGSYGDEESKIDSDLQHLALGETLELDITEDEEEEEEKVATKPEEFDMVRPASATTESSSSEVMPKDTEKQVGKKNANRSNLGLGKKKKVGTKLQNGNEEPSSENVELARFLLNQARNLISSGESLHKALELSLRAAKLFEASPNNKKTCLEWIMCLHVTAAIHCKLKEYKEAIPVLQRSIELPVLEEGEGHALAKFSGMMQLGDTYAAVGQLENSVSCYTEGLTIQKKFLGENDPRVGETCRYLAEALVQALRFDEAEKVCQTALSIHRENGLPGSISEAADRRLMGLICETKGDHENALEHLVLASMAMSSNGQESEVAFVDTSIGDSYLSLSRFDEAICAYQKSLTALKTAKGENHPSVGSVYIRLADLYNRTGKVREAKSYCENALRIYESHSLEMISPEEIASGLTEISVICESMNEVEQAVTLLQKALKIYADDGRGHKMMVAGIEAQMGVMYYMMEKYLDSYNTFKSAVSKLRGTGKKQSTFYGIALNQMGLACVQLDEVEEGVELFEEAKCVLEQECGPYHPETLGVYNNLAGASDAIGRLEDAIELLGQVVGAREEKLGTANVDTEEEKTRLVQLLKEAGGKVTGRKAKSLQTLIDSDLMTSALR